MFTNFKRIFKYNKNKDKKFFRKFLSIFNKNHKNPPFPLKSHPLLCYYVSWRNIYQRQEWQQQEARAADRYLRTNAEMPLGLPGRDRLCLGQVPLALPPAVNDVTKQLLIQRLYAYSLCLLQFCETNLPYQLYPNAIVYIIRHLALFS